MTGHIKCVLPIFSLPDKNGFSAKLCHSSETIPDIIFYKSGVLPGKMVKQVHYLNGNRSYTKRDHLQFHSGRVGKIDDPTSHKRPTVIDSDNCVFTVLFVIHIHDCIEWKRTVSGGEIIFIIKLTVACFLPLETIMVKRSFPGIGRGIFFLSRCR